MLLKFRQVSEAVCPRDTIDSPTFIYWHVRVWVVEGAGIDLKPIGDLRVEEFQRAAAIPAEASFTVGMEHHFWVSVCPRNLGSALEKRPCHKGRTTGFPAVKAMTNRGLHRRAIDSVADLPTKTAALYDLSSHGIFER